MMKKYKDYVTVTLSEQLFTFILWETLLFVFILDFFLEMLWIQLRVLQDKAPGFTYY